MAKDIPVNLRRAMNKLVSSQPYWASLIYEMQFVEVDEKKLPKRLATVDNKDFKFTMATTGRKIFYSRKFVDSLPVPVVEFALAHEVAHPMLFHLSRVYEHSLTTTGWSPKTDSNGRKIMRHPVLWNIAGDYVINQFLKDFGFSLWKDCLYDPKYKGLTTEQVYEQVAKDSKKEGWDLDKMLNNSITGADLGELDMDEVAVTEEEWKDRIVRAAAVAKQAGKLPASLEGFIKEATSPVYPVWLLLENFVNTVVHSDEYSWRKPLSYMMTQGFIIPGPHDEQVAHVSIWYDTSGSVPDRAISKFHKVGGDIIRNAAPARLTVGQCDAAVHDFLDIRNAADWPSEIKVTGRGGTSFVPPFEYLRENNEYPTLMIYLTDLEGSFPETPPPYPVLWVSTNKSIKAPFGTTIYMDGGAFAEDEE